MVVEKITYEITATTNRVQLLDGPCSKHVHNTNFSLRIGDKINLWAADFGCHVYEVINLDQAVHRGVKVTQPPWLAAVPCSEIKRP